MQVRPSSILLRRLNVIKCVSVPSTCRIASDANDDKVSATNHTDEPFDVIVNGGGIVGLSFLVAAQRLPFLKHKRMLLLERQRPLLKIRNDHEFSNRVSSLTHSSRTFFQKIGIWNQFESHTKRIDRMHVWSQDFDRAIRFRNEIDHSLNSLQNTQITSRFADTEMDSVCHVASNDDILQALYTSVNESQISFGTEVTQITASRNLVHLHTADGSSLSTKLLIGCDGFKSLVRNSANFTYIERNLDQVGIVGTVRMNCSSIHSQNSIAYQRFLPSLRTVLALLPLNAQYCSFVLSTSPEHGQECMQMTDQHFTEHLNELIQMQAPIQSNDSLKWLLNQIDQIGSKVLPQVQDFTSLPVIEQTEVASRAAFPLGFGTTLPNLVSSVRGNQCLNVALIGTSMFWYVQIVKGL